MGSRGPRLFGQHRDGLQRFLVSSSSRRSGTPAASRATRSTRCRRARTSSSTEPAPRTAAPPGGATTARWSPIRPTSAPSGTRPSTSRRPDWPPGRPGSAPSSSPSCSIGPTGMIHGTVTDGTNPIAGVKVTAGSASTMTNASGAYTFTLPVATSVRHDGFEVRLPAGLGQRHRGHGRRRRPAGLHALAGAGRHGQRRRQGRLGRQLAALREGRDQGVRAPRPSPSTPIRSPATTARPSCPGFPTPSRSPRSARATCRAAASLPSAPRGSRRRRSVLNWNTRGRSDRRATRRATPIRRVPVPAVLDGRPSGGLVDRDTQRRRQLALPGRCPATAVQQRPTTRAAAAGSRSSTATATGSFRTTPYLNTPSIDLSSVPSPILQFNSDYIDLDSIADVDISTDGGSNWSNVWERAGADDPGPSTQTLDISGRPAARRTSVPGSTSRVLGLVVEGGQRPARRSEVSCSPLPGGLVVGNVLNANNGAGLNGATVENLTEGGSTKTFATPDDPAQPDGLYILFSGERKPTISRRRSPCTGPISTRCWSSRTARLAATSRCSPATCRSTPRALNARVDPAGTDEQDLTLKNTGGAAASFEIVEINAPLLTTVTHGFASEALRRQALARFSKDSTDRADLARNAKGLAPLPGQRPAGKPMAVGDVVASYPTGITFGWGVASSGPNFWLSNLGVAGGDDKDYQYDSATGAQTGNVIDDTGAIGDWAADGAFNSSTGNGLEGRVSAATTRASTSSTRSPSARRATRSAARRGPTPRSAAWRTTRSTTPTSSAAGTRARLPRRLGRRHDRLGQRRSVRSRAWPTTRATVTSSSCQNTDGDDITVLDALNNYAVLGSFNVMDGGSRAFGAFEQAGIEFDCLGNLWAVNQITQVVYNVATRRGRRMRRRHPLDLRGSDRGLRHQRRRNGPPSR